MDEDFKRGYSLSHERNNMGIIVEEVQPMLIKEDLWKKYLDYSHGR